MAYDPFQNRKEIKGILREGTKRTHYNEPEFVGDDDDYYDDDNNNSNYYYDRKSSSRGGCSVLGIIIGIILFIIIAYITINLIFAGWILSFMSAEIKNTRDHMQPTTEIQQSIPRQPAYIPPVEQPPPPDNAYDEEPQPGSEDGSYRGRQSNENSFERDLRIEEDRMRKIEDDINRHYQ